MCYKYGLNSLNFTLSIEDLYQREITLKYVISKQAIKVKTHLLAF